MLHVERRVSCPPMSLSMAQIKTFQTKSGGKKVGFTTLGSEYSSKWPPRRWSRWWAMCEPLRSWETDTVWSFCRRCPGPQLLSYALHCWTCSTALRIRIPWFNKTNEENDHFRLSLCIEAVFLISQSFISNLTTTTTTTKLTSLIFWKNKLGELNFRFICRSLLIHAFEMIAYLIRKLF